MHVQLRLLALSLLAACAAPRPPTGTSLNPWEGDAGRLQSLEEDGECMTGVHAVGWFPKGALPIEEQRAILQRLDRGVGSAKQLIGKPRWSFRGDERVYFYFPDERFVSHAPGGNAAFLPLWRIREDKAPWLHEAIHLLLATPYGDWLAAPSAYADLRMPLWLEEGLAESIAIDVSASAGLTHFSPLFDVPAEELDALCREELLKLPSDRILPLIGARGTLPELLGPDRSTYARPFYLASTSFVRYLTARFGLQALLDAIERYDDELAELERGIGVSLSQAKSDWLIAIGYAPSR